jgi:hypothetical protein
LCLSARAIGPGLTASDAARAHPRLRFIVAHLENAAGRFDPRPGTPAGNERARERGISEVDRDGVIQHAAGSRGRNDPSVRAAVLVEPSGDLGVPRAETAGRNSDSDTHGEAPFGGRDQLAWVAGNRCSLFGLRHDAADRWRCLAAWASPAMCGRQRETCPGKSWRARAVGIECRTSQRGRQHGVIQGQGRK